jgi:hypothetical protein
LPQSTTSWANCAARQTLGRGIGVGVGGGIGVGVGIGVKVAVGLGSTAPATGVRSSADGCGDVGSTARSAEGPPQATRDSSDHKTDVRFWRLPILEESLEMRPAFFAHTPSVIG